MGSPKYDHHTLTMKSFSALVFAALALSANAFMAPMSNIRASSVARMAPATMPRFAVIRMGDDDIYEKVKDLIAENLSVDKDKITPDANFTEDLGADSLDAVELIMALEEEFDIEIPDEEAEKMTSPGQCVEAIKSKL